MASPALLASAHTRLIILNISNPLIIILGILSMSYIGSCHCGDILFEVQGTFDSAMECNCSHCSRKGYLLWFVAKSQFSMKAASTSLSTYTYALNTHEIEHFFCSRCGCAPFGFSLRADDDTVAINIRCLENVSLAAVKRDFFDGRSFSGSFTNKRHDCRSYAPILEVGL